MSAISLIKGRFADNDIGIKEIQSKSKSTFVNLIMRHIFQTVKIILFYFIFFFFFF